MSAQGWFDVDKEGLAKLVERKGMAFVVYELVQNCWDTGTKSVEVSLEPVEGKPWANLRVEDADPDGFKNLSHAWTLFAESEKKGDATKRGRFNLGEKLVLAACREAKISSTTGSVRFTEDGRRVVSHLPSARTEAGSIFEARLRITREEIARVHEATLLLIPPAGVRTVYNGEVLQGSGTLHSFQASLPTEVADADGYLRRVIRQTEVRVHTKTRDVTRLYELGIPVVEHDLPWDVEVMQKVPLNADRDNVTPAYARELAVLVVNEMHSRLSKEEASYPSIQEVLADPRIDEAATETILTHQFGEKRAIHDPSDPEAGRQLVARGYTLIPGGTYSKPAWDNIRASGTLPAGRIAPTPRPYSPNGEGARYLTDEEKTDGMKNLEEYARVFAWKTIAVDIEVSFEKGRMTDPWSANYGGRALTFNVDRLGKKWFDRGADDLTFNELLIHELAHQYGGHLSEAFDDGLAKIGAKAIALALKDPDLFRKHGVKS